METVDMTFEQVRNHQITKDFIEDTKDLLEGYVVEGLPDAHTMRGQETLHIDMSFYYQAGLKENKGLAKLLKDNGWKVCRRDFSGWREEAKHFKFQATKTIEISNQ
ncbi:hypothetical protein C0431_12935 [bacterium]|nr:hypothetical protein [bacterium]